MYVSVLVKELPRSSKEAPCPARREVRPAYADPRPLDQGLARRPADPGSAAMNGPLRELLTAHRVARHPEVAAALAAALPAADGVPLWGLRSVAVGRSRRPAGDHRAARRRWPDLRSRGHRLRFAAQRDVDQPRRDPRPGGARSRPCPPGAAASLRRSHRMAATSSALLAKSWLIEWPPNTAAPSGEDAAQRPLARQRTHRGGSVPCSGC